MALGEAGKTMEAAMLMLQEVSVSLLLDVYIIAMLNESLSPCTHFRQAGSTEWLMIDEGTTNLIREGIAQIELATNEFTKFIDDSSTRVDAKHQMLIQLEVTC